MQTNGHNCGCGKILSICCAFALRHIPLCVAVCKWNAGILLIVGTRVIPFFLTCGSSRANNAVKKVTEIFKLLPVFFFVYILLYHTTPLFLPRLDERLRTMCSAKVWSHIACILEWIEYIYVPVIFLVLVHT